MKIKLIHLLFVMLGAVFAFNLQAQTAGGLQIQTKVVGKVVDEGGIPIPGVFVYPRGNTGAGTATEEDGSFAINVKSKDVLLVFLLSAMSPARFGPRPHPRLCSRKTTRRWRNLW